MKTKTKPPPAKLITGQVVYMGPHLPHLGLGYSAIFRDGIFEHLYDSIARCPAIGELFVPVAQVAHVRRQLAFDYAHNMRGTSGKFVTFYQAIQQWLSNQRSEPKPGVEVKHNA
jgi:hypothetical protein